MTTILILLPSLDFLLAIDFSTWCGPDVLNYFYHSSNFFLIKSFTWCVVQFWMLLFSVCFKEHWVLFWEWANLFTDYLDPFLTFSNFFEDRFCSVQSLSRVRLFATPWIAARQASLSITNSQSSLRFMSIESVMPSSHLILCRPLLLLPSIPHSIKVFFPKSQLFTWITSISGLV